MFLDSQDRLLDAEWIVAAAESKTRICGEVGKWIQSFVSTNKRYADRMKASNLEVMLPRRIHAVLEGVYGTSTMPWHSAWLLLTPKFLVHLLREVWIPIDRGVSLIVHWFFPGQATFFTERANDSKTVTFRSSFERITDSLCYFHYKSSFTYKEAELEARKVKIEKRLHSSQEALTSGLSNRELGIREKMNRIVVLIVQHHGTLLKIGTEVKQIDDEKERMKDTNVKTTSGESRPI